MLQNLKLETTAYTVFVVAFFLSWSDTSHVIMSSYFITFSETREYQKTAWKRVVVGDFIKLQSDEIIPSDLLLLNSSDANSICHIETANLDGETNLKQKEVVKGLNLVSQLTCTTTVFIFKSAVLQKVFFGGGGGSLVWTPPTDPYIRILSFHGYKWMVFYGSIIEAFWICTFNVQPMNQTVQCSGGFKTLHGPLKTNIKIHFY